MSDNQNIVSVSGMYWSGSSAVIDILSEHPSCNVCPEEFSFFSFGQFFEDIYRPISQETLVTQDQYMSLIRSLKFNESEPRYLYSALRVLFRNVGYFPKNLFYRRVGMEKLLGTDYSRASAEFHDYLESCNKTISDIDLDTLNSRIVRVLAAAASGCRSPDLNNSGQKKLDVFDQLIAPPYLQYSLDSLSSLKIVAVDRCWKDQYVEVRHTLKNMLNIHRNMNTRPCGETEQMQTLSPQDYFVELRKLTDETRKQQEAFSEKNVLWIDFEELVHNTFECVTKIFRFLDLDPQTWKPNSIFLPDQSRENVGIWRCSKWQNEISYIEEKLKS